MRADVCAATGDADFFDGGTAAWAGLAFTAEDAGKAEITPPFAFGIDVVFVGAAAFVEG